MEILESLKWPFLASLIIAGIHAYLGVHVVERGVIFVDLALAQIAALGATIGVLAGLDPHGSGSYWISLTFTFLVWVLPRRSNSLSWRARSNFGWISGGISPTSSKNKVP